MEWYGMTWYGSTWSPRDMALFEHRVPLVFLLYNKSPFKKCNCWGVHPGRTHKWMVHDSNDTAKLEAISLLWGHWYCIGTPLVPHWYPIGTPLVPHWYPVPWFLFGVPNAANEFRYRHNWLISGSHRGNQDVWEPNPPGQQLSPTVSIHQSISIRYLSVTYQLPTIAWSSFIPGFESIAFVGDKVLLRNSLGLRN